MKVNRQSTESFSYPGRVVMLLFHLAAVDDEDDVVDGDGSLGDVRGQDDLLDAGRSSFEHELLVLSR